MAFFFKQWGGTRKKKTGRLLDGRTWDEYPPDARDGGSPESRLPQQMQYDLWRALQRKDKIKVRTFEAA